MDPSSSDGPSEIAPGEGHEGTVSFGEAAAAEKSNYLVRHWRGELSLGVSYWLNFVLLNLLIASLAALCGLVHEAAGLRTGTAVLVLLYGLSIPVAVWQIVGTWRSAGKHVERGGQPVWSVLARLVLFVGALNLVRVTVDHTGPQIIEFCAIVAGDKQIPPYEIIVLPGGTELEFRGGLRAGCSKEFERKLEAAPEVRVLHVNSVGGRLHEAKRMARVVRDRRLTTYTSEGCLSAATLIFLAGKERVLARGAAMGFHMPDLPGITQIQRRGSEGFMGEMMRDAGVSDAFIKRVLATSHEEMWYPTVEEMRSAWVLTSESFGERFAVSGSTLRNSSPEAIDQSLCRVPTLLALKRLEPITYSGMVHKVSAAIQAGETEGKAFGYAREVGESLMPKYLPKASDEAVTALRDTWVAILKELRGKDSKACLAIFSPKAAATNPNFNAARLLPATLQTNLMDAVEQVLCSASNDSAPSLNKRLAEHDLNDVRLKLFRRFGARLDLLGKEDQWMGHADEVCEVLLAFYQETQALPERQQANLLRYLQTPDSVVAKAPEPLF